MGIFSVKKLVLKAHNMKTSQPHASLVFFARVIESCPKCDQVTAGSGHRHGNSDVLYLSGEKSGILNIITHTHTHIYIYIHIYINAREHLKSLILRWY